jgi:hypothetical protein
MLISGRTWQELLARYRHETPFSLHDELMDNPQMTSHISTGESTFATPIILEPGGNIMGSFYHVLHPAWLVRSVESYSEYSSNPHHSSPAPTQQGCHQVHSQALINVAS